MSHLPDEVLARRAAAGQLDCFESLLARYRDRVYRLCYRMAGNAEDAEDWAQECFVRVYEQLGRYDPAFPFVPWLLRVVSNTCINLGKSRARWRQRFPLGLNEETSTEQAAGHRAAAVETSAAAAAQGKDPLRVALLDEETGAIQEAVDALAPTLKQAVVLRVQEELSFREVAEILGVPLQTAATRVRRALLEVRNRLIQSGFVTDEEQQKP